MRQGSLVAHSGTGAAISTALGKGERGEAGLVVAAARLGIKQGGKEVGTHSPCRERAGRECGGGGARRC
jgi:hypothetical protein